MGAIPLQLANKIDPKGERIMLNTRYVLQFIQMMVIIQIMMMMMIMIIMLILIQMMMTMMMMMNDDDDAKYILSVLTALCMVLRINISLT